MIPTRFATTLTISRPPSGSYVDGQWIEGDPTTVTLTAVVQPMSARERLLLPEATRSRATVKVYTDESMQAADESAQVAGDRFTWDGRTWEVFSTEHQAAGTLAHYKSLAALVDLPAEEGYDL